MPVQYQPVATVKPEEARRTAEIPALHLEVPHVEFTKAISKAIEARGEATIQLGHSMATVAASIGTLGKAVSGAGDEMWTRAVGLAELENEKKVNDAVIGYEQGQSERNEKFKSLQGAAADSGSLKAYLTESENARQAIKGTLSPYGQKLYDQQTMRSYIQDSRAAASHAANQTKAATAGSFEAKGNTILDGMGNAKDQVDFDRGKGDFAVVTRQLCDLHGWGNEQCAQFFSDKVGHAALTRAKIIAEDQPSAGREILDQLKGKVNAEKWMQADNTVRGIEKRRDTRGVTDDVMQEMPDASLEDQQRRGDELVEKRHKGDIELRDMTRERISAEHSRQEKIKVDNYNRDMETIGDRIYSKSPPKTPEEAMVDPDFKKAYDNRNNAERNEIDKRIYQANHPDLPSNPALYHKWSWNIAKRDPETLQALANDNGIIDRLEMSNGERSKLWTEFKAEMKRQNKSEGTLKTEHGFNVLKRNGYGKTIKEMSSGTQSAFQSVLSSLAEAEERRLKRPLKDEDWIRLGNHAFEDDTLKGVPGLLGKHDVTTKYWKTFDIAKGMPEYKDFKTRYLKAQEEMGRRPNDVEIQREFNGWKIEQDLAKDEKRGKVKTIPIKGGG